MNKDDLLFTRPLRVAVTGLLALSALIAGCSDKRSAEPAKGMLRVPMYDEESFSRSYGDYFAVKFPEVDVQVIPTKDLFGPDKNYYEGYTKLIREQKPDLLITYDPAEYQRWANEGLLLDLEPFVRKSKFDLDSFTPAALAQLRLNDEGKLYGLAPELSSSALYYNKDLFDKFGVPYPTDKMTWEQTMQLARRFPVDPNPEKRIYGIHEKYWTPFDFIADIAATEGADFLSPDGKRVTLESDIWKKAFGHVIDGFKKGNLFYYYKDGKPINYGPEETKQMDLFSSSKAAMMISGTEQMFRMKQWGETGLNWGIVTVPVDPANPDVTRHLRISPIYAVSSNAEHPETAWKAVQYFNSEEAAKVSQKTSDVLSTRTAFAKTKDGRSLDPFYSLKPKKQDDNAYAAMPGSYYMTFLTLVIREIDEAVNGRKTVEEAMRTIQKEGQASLDQAWMEEKAKPGGK
ncbi:ABC transporter substrate-binding protein [Paenibacillus hodogayensis]|uniref:ABC transporter substrate-binding protein n=1 Tax=Paenibacillus hodogayensis TaxID=279208 RepID=A0ABV5VTQ2_9BACL